MSGRARKNLLITINLTVIYGLLEAQTPRQLVQVAWVKLKQASRIGPVISALLKRMHNVLALTVFHCNAQWPAKASRRRHNGRLNRAGKTT